MVSGIHWGSWNISLTDKGDLLYSTFKFRANVYRANILNTFIIFPSQLVSHQLTCCISILALTTWSQHRPHKLRAQSSIWLPPLQTLTQVQGIFQAMCTSDQLTTNLRVPTMPSGSIVQQNSSQNLGKHYAYEYIRTEAREDTLREKSWRVLNAELLCPLPIKSGHVTLPTHQYVFHLGISTEPRCPEFLLEFHYVGVIDGPHGQNSVSTLLPFPGSQKVRLISHGAKLHLSLQSWSFGTAGPHPEAIYGSIMSYLSSISKTLL